MTPAKLKILRERGLRLLARRDHSRAELAGKLRKGLADIGDPEGASCSETVSDVSLDAFNALLDEFEQAGFLSDARFASARVRVRATRFGNARVSQELRMRGVDDAVIASVMEEAGDELMRARAIREKKFGEMPQEHNEWAKQARFLQSRGFSSGIIRQVMETTLDDTSNTTEVDAN